MKKLLNLLAIVLMVAYPVVVFACLVVFHVQVRVLSLFMIVVALSLFLSFSGGKKIDKRPMISGILFFAVGFTCFMTQKVIFLKLYSVVISAASLFIFGITLFSEPTIIFRFATFADKTIVGSAKENAVKKYCRKVTIAWCVFFIVNGIISSITAFCGKIFNFIDDDTATMVWSVYNGGISYVLMGLLFAVEFLVRRQVNAKIEKQYGV